MRRSCVATQVSANPRSVTSVSCTVRMERYTRRFSARRASSYTPAHATHSGRRAVSTSGEADVARSTETVIMALARTYPVRSVATVWRILASLTNHRLLPDVVILQQASPTLADLHAPSAVTVNISANDTGTKWSCSIQPSRPHQSTPHSPFPWLASQPTTQATQTSNFSHAYPESGEQGFGVEERQDQRYQLVDAEHVLHGATLRTLTKQQMCYSSSSDAWHSAWKFPSCAVGGRAFFGCSIASARVRPRAWMRGCGRMRRFLGTLQ